jgi:hypothetical protein
MGINNYSIIASDDDKTVKDIYLIITNHLKKASTVCPPNGEILDGVNNRGRCSA